MRGSLLLLAGCGRIAFDARVDSTGDGAFANANRAFVSSFTLPGTFGSLSVPDDMCTAAAARAGHAGTYRAFLATSGASAQSRFAGSRGWVRVDGAPIADTIDELITGKMFNTLDRDENNAQLRTYVFTGTGPMGELVQNCSDWTAGPAIAAAGASIYPPPSLFAGNSGACTDPHNVYCFEVGNDTPLTPPATPGRLVFISNVRPINGLAAFDAQCMADAIAAGLPGAFRAAVATTTASISSRFKMDARTWRRVDGTSLATGADIFDGFELSSFINQKADGTYLPIENVWTGATGPHVVGTPSLTCDDWSPASFGSPGAGLPHYVEVRYVWYAAPVTAGCANGLLPVLCLQE